MRIRLVDVGARDSIHGRWAPFHSELDVIAFEPDLTECTRLNTTDFPYAIRFLPVALGAKNDEAATLYITKAPGCSSTLKPNTELVSKFPFGPNMEIARTQPVKLQRMDSVLTLLQPDVMKIDTQGTELDVLIGAGTLLDNTIAVELEVEFVEQYLGQALFADVDAFMRSKGFTLRGIRRTFWRHKAEHRHASGGQLIHGDALYLRMDRIGSPVSLKILAAYRQFDLLAAHGAAHLIPRMSKWRTLLGKLGVNRELRRFVDSLRPATAGDWHDPDFF
jgi:FkbM family methyltransferase